MLNWIRKCLCRLIWGGQYYHHTRVVKIIKAVLRDTYDRGTVDAQFEGIKRLLRDADQGELGLTINQSYARLMTIDKNVDNEKAANWASTLRQGFKK